MLTDEQLAEIERWFDSDDHDIYTFDHARDLLAEVKQLREENALQAEYLQKVGTIHNGCPNTQHDVICPWCRIAELEQRLDHLADLARTADHETSEAYILHDSITDLIAACKDGGEGR